MLSLLLRFNKKGLETSMEVEFTKNSDHGLTHDAMPPKINDDSTPSGSKETVEVKVRHDAPPRAAPVEVKEEGATIGTISILFATLMETVFRFKEPEEHSLLKQLCDTIYKKSPEEKFDISEIVDMYYDIDEGVDDLNNVIAQCYKRHETGMVLSGGMMYDDSSFFIYFFDAFFAIVILAKTR